MDIILPGPFNSTVFKEEMLRAMNQVVDAYAVDFDATVRTWNNQPAFRKTVRDLGNEIVGQYVTDSDIYKFVSRGTRIRFAVMTDDFQPKTLPGLIGSFPGRGGFSHIDFQSPRPGIIPRRFEETIRNKYRRSIPVKFQVAINRAIDRSGHKFI